MSRGELGLPGALLRLRSPDRFGMHQGYWDTAVNSQRRAGERANAILAERVGCERHEPFGTYHGTPIGRAGTFAGDGIPAAELFERVRAVTARVPTVFDAGPERVRRIGIVSGAGSDVLPEAVALGFDAFLTGEPREHVMADVREAGIHFIAAGHYATETFGVRALGDWLAERFGIEHVWVDIPNPV